MSADKRERLIELVQQHFPADYHDGVHLVDCEACASIVDVMLAAQGEETKRLRGAS